MPQEMKVFRTADADEEDLIPFRVEGRTLKGDEWCEDYHALPRVPAGVLDDMTTFATMDTSGNVSIAKPVVLSFFEAVLVDEDHERFRDMMHDRTRLVDIQLLGEIMDWLGEQIAGLPTAPRSTSTRGPRQGTSTSKGRRSARR